MDYDATDIPVAYDRGRDHGRGFYSFGGMSSQHTPGNSPSIPSSIWVTLRK
jgi:hypothetical protein